VAAGTGPPYNRQVRKTGDGKVCQCETFAAATERAALASGRWLGRGDLEGAQEAATSGMRAALDSIPISGRIVIGAESEDRVLEADVAVGTGGQELDLAVDPLEGPSVVARGGPGAMAMIAVGDPGSFLRVPQMYMRKMAVGPVARERIDLRRPVADNVRAIAEAYGRNPNDVTAIVLDRPRHHDLIEELRGSGARIKLIQDGDVTAAITASIRGTNDHLAIGIGGARQTVLTAAALRCLGGELQAQFWPVSRTEIAQAREYGFEDMDKVFTLDELAPPDVVVAATGVTNGDLLRGVRYMADSARTQSLVMCTRCNWVRFVDGIHFFARERREEVRLLG
jgi:fructose-1,6-bisphosphatase II